MVLNLPHLPLETSLVPSAGGSSCGSRPQGKSPPSRSEIRASLQTGYLKRKQKMALEKSLMLVFLRYHIKLCMQSEEETPKQLSKDKAHRSGLENGEPKIFDQKETEYL